MPSTSGGHVYEETDITLPNGMPGRITLPTVRAETDVPTMIYCHGNNGTYTQFNSNGYAPFLDAVIGHGVAVLQTTAGAAADDTGGNNYANDFGIDAYRSLVDAADATYDVGSIVVFGSSAGGMIASYLAAIDEEIAPRSTGLCLHRGVVNAHIWRIGNNLGTQTPPTPYDPEWQRSQLAVYLESWGVTGQDTEEEYEASGVPERDPMLYPNEVWEGVGNVLNLCGSIDSTVPPYWHGQLLHDTRLDPLLGDDAVLVVTTGSDHSANPPSTFAEVDALRAWLVATVGPSITDPDSEGAPSWYAPDVYVRANGRWNRAIDVMYYDGSRWYRVLQFGVRPDPARDIVVVNTTTAST